MITRSFRAKVALLAMVMAVAVLSVSGLYLYKLMQSTGVDRVDRELTAIAEGQTRGPHPPDFWPNFGRSLQFVYGDRMNDLLAVKVELADGTIPYLSHNWSSEFDNLGLPEPEWIPPPPRAFARPHRPPDAPPPRHRRDPPLRHRKPMFLSRAAARDTWRLGVFGNEIVTLTLGMNLDVLHPEHARYRNGFLIAGPLILLGLTAGGWYLAQRSLRPVRDITSTVAGISASGLHRRIEAHAADAEFTELIDAVNRMLERLEASFEQANRFSSDAAHELNTPLTILQGELDHALQREEDGSSKQQLYHHLLEEVQRLKSIVRKLLLLARADTGHIPYQAETIPFSDFLNEAAEDTEAIADHLEVKRRIQPGVAVTADPVLVLQIVQNLTSNAVKYNRLGGVISFDLTTDNGSALFSLTNTGTPIPADDQPFIFDRFFRVDRSRSKTIEGQGLGLPLARELTRAQGGDLRLTHSDFDGTTFTLELPLA